MQRGQSLMNKLAGKPKYEDERGNRQWIHPNKALAETFVTYQARYIGCTEVEAAKGIEVIKDAIKRIKFQHEIKKSEAGKKGSKLQKVEIWISIDVIKIVNVKSKEVITQKPLHRISYCADDHNDKKLFSFIAREQESKTHICHAFITEREAAELTVTLGQAFELAYKRYLHKGKQETKENKEMIDLKKQVEQARAENAFLKQKLNGQGGEDSPRRTQSIDSSGSNNSLPMAPLPQQQQQQQPSLLVDFGMTRSEPKPQEAGFDPFDSYLSNLAVKRGLGAAETPEQLIDRGPFQSPLQKNPDVNPFEVKQVPASNPFDAFFPGQGSPAVTENGSEMQSGIPGVSPACTRGPGATQFLPPPPSKQSIKAANALKMKPAQKSSRSPEPVQGDQKNTNGNFVEFASTDLLSLGMKKDESISSIEQSLAAGLQFDSYNFDPLQ